MKRTPLKRTRLKSVSDKRRQRMEEVRGFRRELIQQHKCCMVCGTSPKHPKWNPGFQNDLCCHEILNGPLRDKVLDEPSCIIVACLKCNMGPLNCKGDWPLSRQLAVIKAVAPERYNLERVLELRNPNAPRFVTEGEVDEWIERNQSEPV